MKSVARNTTLLAAAMLCGALLTNPAAAAVDQDAQPFSALKGIEAQTLSAAEMDSIQGAALTVADIRAALAAAIVRLSPAVQTAILTRFDTVTAPRIQALLDRLAALRK